MAKAPQNPGVEQNSQLISISVPFGGWVIPLAGTSTTPHYVASGEGVEAPLTKPSANQYAESDGISLFHNEKFGHIAPGSGFSVMSDALPVLTDLPLNGDSISSGFLAATVLKNGYVVQIDPPNAAVSQTLYYVPTSHTPISSINGDMIVFRDYQATSAEWVVWSWEYSGGADVSIIHSIHLGNSDSSAVDGWYSGIAGIHALTQGVPHKLCKGPDGNIYVLNGAYVQQVVIASTAALGSATAGNYLPLGSGWVATGICSFKNYTAIIASSRNSTNATRGETRVFFWDGLTTTVNGVTSTAPEFIFDIPDNFGNGIFFDGNTLSAFTSGRNNSSKIFEYSSKGFIKVFESPFVSPTTTPIQGSVEKFQDGLMIGATKANANAHLMRWYGNGFHDEGYLSDGENSSSHLADTVGMIKNLFTNQLTIGISYAGSPRPYKIFVTNLSTYQTSTSGSTAIDFRTILYTSGILGRRLYPMGFKMSVTRIKIFFSQWGTGAALKLSLFEGYNAMSVGGATDRLNLLLDTDSTTAESITHHAFPAGTYEMDISDISITDLSSFYMNLRWSHATVGAGAAIIRRMEIHVSQSQ